MTDPIIRFDKVAKRFGDISVLDGLDFTVSRGEKVTIIGPSGSGKSTILRILMTLEDISDGTVWVDGEPLWHEKAGDGTLKPASEAHLHKMRGKLGMVFQSFNLFPHMTVLRNITEAPVQVLGLSKPEAKDRAMGLLDMVGLSDHAEKYPHQMSGGQQQRVAIARALALEPKIMLFDEATSALDPELTGEVLNVMRGLAEEGMTMVVVTHEIGFAATVGSQLSFLDQGRLLFTGPPAEVFAKPRHPRLEQFLDTYLDRGASTLV